MAPKHYLCAVFPVLIACAGPTAGTGDPNGRAGLGLLPLGVAGGGFGIGSSASDTAQNDVDPAKGVEPGSPTPTPTVTPTPTPTPTPKALSCTAESCPTLSNVAAGQTISLWGRGFKRRERRERRRHREYLGADVDIEFMTEWGLVGDPPAPGVSSLTASSCFGSDVLFRDGAAVDGHVHARMAGVSGSYDFVEAFTVSDAMGNEIYRGYHGVAPTAAAMKMATGTAFYHGETFGEIADRSVTGQAGAVYVSGGTATATVDFSSLSSRVSLAMTLADTLPMIDKTLEISYAEPVLLESGEYSPLMTVKVGGIDSTDRFDEVSSSARGGFYGWHKGRSVPAEMGGNVNFLGTDPSNFVNLFFLGKLGDGPTPPTQ